MRTTPFRRLSVSPHTHSVLCGSAFQRVCFSNGRILHAARPSHRLFRPAPRLNARPKTPDPKTDPKRDLEKVNDVSFWPTELLRISHSDGSLSLSWIKAIQFLTKVRNLKPSPSSESMKRLCLEYEIEPLTLTILAKILKRSGLKDCQPTAGRLMIAASRLHDPGATLSLVHEAIRTSKLSHPDMIGPRTHLEILVKNDKDPAAMILLAQIREVQGRTDEALRLYEGAANANSDTYTGFEAVEYDIGESWAKVSRLRLGKGDLEGARAAIEKAAFEYDKPMAYYYLATDHQTQDPADYLRYLLKAAASGVIPAAQCLGMYYEMQWKQNVGISPGGKASIEGEVEVGSLSPKKHPSMSKEEFEMNRLLATEWFTVAAEAGHHRSRISLAIILRSSESVQEGMDWLNREAFPANWTNGVAALKDSWWDHEIDMKWVDIDELQNWKP